MYQQTELRDATSRVTIKQGNIDIFQKINSKVSEEISSIESTQGLLNANIGFDKIFYNQIEIYI